jgi:hypothetical protein
MEWFIRVGPLIVVRNLGHPLGAIFVPDQRLVNSPRFLSPLPPTSNDHHTNISDVKPYEDQRLPQKEPTVPKDSDNQRDGDEEEPDISQERVPLHLEGPNDAHGTHHAAHDERGSPKQLPNRQTTGVGPHGREGREHIRTTVSESEERYSGDIFIQSEGLGDRSEIWAEEVGGTYADCREEECEPNGEARKGPGPNFRFCTKVSLDMMDREEGIRLRTFLLDVFTLILEGQRGRPALMMSTGPVSHTKTGGRERLERSINDKLKKKNR